VERVWTQLTSAAQRLTRSFYGKLSALFLILIVGLGLVLGSLGVQAARRYAQEAEQKLNRTLADDLAPRFQPSLRDSVDYAGIRATIQQMMGINRRIEIYLLEEDGTIKASFTGEAQSLAQRGVDLEPVDRFIDGAALPILGDDPLHRGHQVPFSATHVTIAGQESCYLYIVLDSGQYASMMDLVNDSAIMRTALQGLGLILLVTAGVGLLLFGGLTRRLRSMTSVMAAFERGDFDQRMDVTAQDEIGQLARCFNQMADTLVDTMEELRQSDRMRRELVANVSHDLRSPLASIQGYLETVLMKGEALDASERERYIRTSLRNTRRLNDLVAQLFELSKLDARDIEPQVEPFSLTELVQDVVMQFKPRAEENDIDLCADLPEQLTLVRADIALIERALSNLIDNALQYTQAGDAVRIAVTNHGPMVTTRVRDTGAGIPDEDLPHIFDRFYRVEKSRNREQGGAGLGLAIAQKIVHLHDQQLEVESVLGEGTAFTFTLPAVREVKK
jgi:signal transduction histidine kinase